MMAADMMDSCFVWVRVSIRAVDSPESFNASGAFGAAFNINWSGEKLS